MNSIRNRLLRWMSAALATTLISSWCVAATTSQGPTAQATLDALTRAHAAVVGLQITTAEGARSAETLGKERSGSGVVIGPDGLILTIGYLMLEADSIQITTQDNKSVPGRAVGYDLATGFGLIRPLLPLRGIAAVPMGSHSTVRQGEALMAATGGEAGDVMMTQLVSKRAFSGYWEYHIDTALFTSPPVTVAGGNHSGAPLFNQSGELLGIGSLFVMDALGNNRRLPGNMFVPVDLLRPILVEMQQTGSTRSSRRPWLGLTSNDQAGRIQVVRVAPESPAQAAGLRPGDVVLAVGGTKVSTLESFYKKLWEHESPETLVQLTVLQGAEVKTITVQSIDRMSTLKRPAGI